ncbi:hypothetical protein IJH29_00585 [Candidatus Saccharibacteria bacterium]|nr:hypothetical protein [Candidatus Saccharibacteria bacterium]
MKRIVTLCLVLCIALGLAPAAFASGCSTPTPCYQPTTSTVFCPQSTTTTTQTTGTYVTTTVSTTPACGSQTVQCNPCMPYVRPCTRAPQLCYTTYAQKISAQSVGEYRAKVTKALKLALKVRCTGWEVVKECGIQSKASGSHSTLVLRHIASGREIELVEWGYTHSNSSCKPDTRKYYTVFVWEYFAKTKIANLPSDDFITSFDLDYEEAINELICYLNYVAAGYPIYPNCNAGCPETGCPETPDSPCECSGE